MISNWNSLNTSSATARRRTRGFGSWSRRRPGKQRPGRDPGAHRHGRASATATGSGGLSTLRRSTAFARSGSSRCSRRRPWYTAPTSAPPSRTSSSRRASIATPSRRVLGVSPSENGASAEHVVDAPGNGGPSRATAAARRDGASQRAPDPRPDRDGRRPPAPRTGPDRSHSQAPSRPSPAGRSGGAAAAARAAAAGGGVRRDSRRRGATSPPARLPIEDLARACDRPSVTAVAQRGDPPPRPLDHRAGGPDRIARGAPGRNRPAGTATWPPATGSRQGDRRLRARQLRPGRRSEGARALRLEPDLSRSSCYRWLDSCWWSGSSGNPGPTAAAWPDWPSVRRQSRCSPTPSARPVPTLGRGIHAAGHESSEFSPLHEPARISWRSARPPCRRF